MESSLGDSCGYRFQPGATRLTTDLTWGCARVTSVTYRRQTRGEWVKGHDCFGREFEKGVECEATGIMCVALRCVCIYILYQLLPKPINSFHLHNISHFLYIAYTIYLNFIYITYITYISYVPFSSPASSTSTSSTSHASSTSLTESIGARRLQNSYNVICP